MRRFLRNDRGTVAVIFALMAVPFIALAGWAVDYIRLQHVKDHLQAQADIAAINALVPDAPEEQWRGILMAELDREYQGDWARNVDAQGGFIAPLDYRVSVSADVPLSFMRILPNIGDTQEVQVAATARLSQPVWTFDIEVTDLDYEAGDFNRLWLYCYWPDRPDNEPERPKRTQMVPIADNGGSTFEIDPGAPKYGIAIEDAMLANDYAQVIANHAYGVDGREDGIWRIKSGAGTGDRVYRYVPPICDGDSYMSFRLENVRFARTQPTYWDEGAPTNHGHSGRFNYYTDTYLDPDVPGEQYDGLVHPDTSLPVDILETVLCDTLEECVPQSEGGIIPEGEHRTPEQASQSCSEGKYMYYGWEDRPPGQQGPNATWEDYAWTDADFDDIRVVVQCPVLDQTGEQHAWLIN